MKIETKLRVLVEKLTNIRNTVRPLGRGRGWEGEGKEAKIARDPLKKIIREKK